MKKNKLRMHASYLLAKGASRAKYRVEMAGAGGEYLLAIAEKNGEMPQELRGTYDGQAIKVGRDRYLVSRGAGQVVALDGDALAAAKVIGKLAQDAGGRVRIALGGSVLLVRASKATGAAKKAKKAPKARKATKAKKKATKAEKTTPAPTEIAAP